MESKNRNKRSFGSIGESIAVNHLTKNNYYILQQNFRVGRMGEIDIIARENEYICFIEVKTRTSTLFGMPSEAVNKKKQHSIIRLANVYLNMHKLHDRNVRFDIVEIIVNKNSQGIEVKNINVIKNAF